MATNTAPVTTSRPEPRRVDPRGPRFGAVITTAVLALILILGPTSGLGGVLLGLQLLVFAAGAVLGLGAQPYGWIFRRFVRPRLAPPTELEDQAPPRFAQAVGMIFAAVGAFAMLVGLSPVFYVAVAAALGAAFLNAAFNFCLGCEMYLTLKKLGIGNKTAPQV